MKKTTIFLLFACLATPAIAQVSLLKPQQQPAPSTAPVTYDTGANTNPTPVSVSPAPSGRRAAAVAKVQGSQPASNAKGLRPAEYSTGNDMSPAMYSTESLSTPAPAPATTVTVNGQNVQRQVQKGRGQVGNELFTPVSELHYVQFAVYCQDTPVDKAPTIDGLYLLWHPGSTCPNGEQGASYIVKGYVTPQEAKDAVAAYKAAKIDCWYNPALTGAEVEIIGVR
ncbi:MAG: hypothetical protein IT260_14535 [Saprospiraceae bacterium]|nr:hypothetical protein [Saprospiraceae bacterium]